MVLHDLQERRAIVFELGVADAMDFEEGARARRPMGGKLGQGAVGKYNVGRNLLFLRQPGAQTLQSLEQGGVHLAGVHGQVEREHERPAEALEQPVDVEPVAAIGRHSPACGALRA